MVTAVQDRLVVTLEEAKNYLRVDHDEDDSLIETLVSAAKASADAFLNNPFPTSGPYESGIPAPVKVWVLRRVAATYENRLEGARSDDVHGLGRIDYGALRGDMGGSADFSIIRSFRLNPGL